MRVRKKQVIRKEMKEGDTRIVKKFALFPISSKRYIIWLETYQVRQVCRSILNEYFENELCWFDVEIIE